MSHDSWIGMGSSGPTREGGGPARLLRRSRDRWTPRGDVCVWFFLVLFFLFSMGVRCGSLCGYVCLSLCRDVGAVVDGARTVFSTKTVDHAVGRSVGRSVAVASRRVASARLGRFFRASRDSATPARASEGTRERASANERVVTRRSCRIKIGRRSRSESVRRAAGAVGRLRRRKIPRRSPRRFARARR